MPFPQEPDDPSESGVTFLDAADAWLDGLCDAFPPLRARLPKLEEAAQRQVHVWDLRHERVLALLQEEETRGLAEGAPVRSPPPYGTPDGKGAAGGSQNRQRAGWHGRHRCDGVCCVLSWFHLMYASLTLRCFDDAMLTPQHHAPRPRNYVAARLARSLQMGHETLAVIFSPADDPLPRQHRALVLVSMLLALLCVGAGGRTTPGAFSCLPFAPHPHVCPPPLPCCA